MGILHTVTFKRRFTHFWTIFIYLFVDILAVFYLVSVYGGQDLTLYILLAAVAFLLMFLPTIYVHLQYHKRNRNDKLWVDYENSIGEYSHDGKSIRFHFTDIRHLEQYKTPPVIEQRWPWFPFATYNYAKVILNDGKEFIITCFLVDELDLPIDRAKVKLHRVLYPNIKKK